MGCSPAPRHDNGHTPRNHPSFPSRRVIIIPRLGGDELGEAILERLLRVLVVRVELEPGISGVGLNVRSHDPLSLLGRALERALADFALDALGSLRVSSACRTDAIVESS